VTPNPKPHTAGEINWGNLFSSRFWMGSLLGAVIAGGLASLLWDPLLYIIGIPVLLILFYVNLTERAYYCPYCRKRVKTGAVICHHCGSNVVEP
jgi:hypothetical protein